MYIHKYRLYSIMLLNLYIVNENNNYTSLFFHENNMCNTVLYTRAFFNNTNRQYKIYQVLKQVSNTGRPLIHTYLCFCFWHVLVNVLLMYYQSSLMYIIAYNTAEPLTYIIVQKLNCILAKSNNFIYCLQLYNIITIFKRKMHTPSIYYQVLTDENALLTSLKSEKKHKIK